MQCPRCQCENPQTAKFCEECGTVLLRLCPRCNHEVSPGARFCSECGHHLDAGSPAARFPSPVSYTPKHLADKILTSRSALHGERKPVTVLFADVVGFSTLAEQLDPETIHTLMDGCFAILTEQVHAYEGTINQFTGDGIMALFGALIAHEDHAVRALHAALSIQAALQDYSAVVQRQWGVPFQMRLGLNTGMVREYSFKHVLTQEVVYGTLLRPQREVYHEWVGEALEALYPDRLEEYWVEPNKRR
jgi:ribosomal protein L40E